MPKTKIKNDKDAVFDCSNVVFEAPDMFDDSCDTTEEMSETTGSIEWSDFGSDSFNWESEKESSSSAINKDTEDNTRRRSRKRREKNGKREEVDEEEEQRIRTSIQNSRKLNAYNWWGRLGRPSKKMMLKRCGRGDMAECDLSPDDVELLPWLAGGFVVDVPSMMKFIAEAETLSPKDERKKAMKRAESRRRLSAADRNSRRSRTCSEISDPPCKIDRSSRRNKTCSDINEATNRTPRDSIDRRNRISKNCTSRMLDSLHKEEKAPDSSPREERENILGESFADIFASESWPEEDAWPENDNNPSKEERHNSDKENRRRNRKTRSRRSLNCERDETPEEPEEVHEDTRRLKAYNWWTRLGHLKKKDFIKRCGKGDVDITPDDVELLPWMPGGYVVDVPQVMKWLAETEASKPEKSGRSSPKKHSKSTSRTEGTDRKSKRCSTRSNSNEETRRKERTSSRESNHERTNRECTRTPKRREYTNSLTSPAQRRTVYTNALTSPSGQRPRKNTQIVSPISEEAKLDLELSPGMGSVSSPTKSSKSSKKNKPCSLDQDKLDSLKLRSLNCSDHYRDFGKYNTSKRNL